MGLAGKAPLKDSDEIVSLADWRERLWADPVLSAEQKRYYLGAILSLLRICKRVRRPLSAGLIRWQLGRPERPDGVSSPERPAYVWLFQTARKAGAIRASDRSFTPPAVEPGEPAGDRRRYIPAGRTVLPPLAAADQGGADWERALIAAIRGRGFLWRTEQTYRAWAARFAQHLAPRSPYAATGEDVAAFLSVLAVERRIAPSTQKQALNALVFLMQEALRRTWGKWTSSGPPPAVACPRC